MKRRSLKMLLAVVTLGAVFQVDTCTIIIPPRVFLAPFLSDCEIEFDDGFIEDIECDD